MSEEIIRYVRDCSFGSRFVVELSRHSSARTHSARTKDAQIQTLKIVQEKYGGNACVFLGDLRARYEDVKTSAVINYGRSQIGFD